jgi:hypothetical protein
MRDSASQNQEAADAGEGHSRGNDATGGARDGGFHAFSETRASHPVRRGGGSGAVRHVGGPVAHLVNQDP